MYNLGERRCLMRLQEKSKDELEICFQVVEDVQKPLLAVSAHLVVFSEQPHIKLSNGTEIPLRYKNGTYELDIWVKNQAFARQSRP